jgi:cytidine deaminase
MNFSVVEDTRASLIRELKLNSYNEVSAVGSSAIRSLARGLGSTLTLGSSFRDAQYSKVIGRRKLEESLTLNSSEPLLLSSSIQVKSGLPSIADLLDAACNARDASIRNCISDSGPIERIENAPVRVGAALLARSGKVYVGSTIDVFGSGLTSENNVCSGSLSGSLSAETVALIKAVSDGDTVFEALIIACNSDDVHVFPTTASSKVLASYGDFDVYAARSDRILVKRKVSDLAQTISLKSEVDLPAGSNTGSDSDTLSTNNHETLFSEIPVLKWSVGHVLAWVDKCLGLPQYQHLFRDCSVDGFLLLSLSSSDLKLLLRIEHPLHRRKAEQGIQRLIERKNREQEKLVEPTEKPLSSPVALNVPLKTLSKTNSNDGGPSLKSDVSAKTVQFNNTKKVREGTSRAEVKTLSVTLGSSLSNNLASVSQKSNEVLQNDKVAGTKSVTTNVATSEMKIENKGHTSVILSELPSISPKKIDERTSLITQKHSIINQVDAVPIIEMAANLHDDTKRLLHPQQVLRLYHVFQDAYVSANSGEVQRSGPLQPMSSDDSIGLLGRPTNSKEVFGSSFANSTPFDTESFSFAHPAVSSNSVISPENIKRDVTTIRLSNKMLISASRRLGYFGTVSEGECARLMAARGKVNHEHISVDSVSSSISFSDFADFVAGVFQHGSVAHSTACAAANRLSAIAAAQVQLSQLAQVQAAQANALRLSLGLPATISSHINEKRDDINSTALKPIPVVDSRGQVLFIHPIATNRNFPQESTIGVTLPNLEGTSLLGTSLDVMNASLANASAVSFPPVSTLFSANVRDGCVVQVSINMVDGWAGSPGTDPWYTSGLDYNTYAVRVLRKQSSIFEEIIDSPSLAPVLSSSFVKQDDPTSSGAPSPVKQVGHAVSNGAASVSSIHSQDSRHQADFTPDDIKVRTTADESIFSGHLNVPNSNNNKKIPLQMNDTPKQPVRSKLTLADTREIKPGELLAIGVSVIARKGGEKKAYPALITGMRKRRDGSLTYSVEFSNDVEEHDLLPKYIRVVLPVSIESQSSKVEGTATSVSESKFEKDREQGDASIIPIMQNEKPGPKFAIGDNVRARFGDRNVARITNVRDRDGDFSYDMINLGIGGVKISSVPERDLEGHIPLSGRVTPTQSEVKSKGVDGKSQEGKNDSESKL